MAETCETTASIVMSFAQKLEESSILFYKSLAEKQRESQESFLAFAKESEKNRVLLIRTYQETITDALEACFSFKTLNLKDYSIEASSVNESDYAEALRTAIKLEEKAIKFYIDAVEQSKSLLATIPRAFKKVAETRIKRKETLKALIRE